MMPALVLLCINQQSAHKIGSA